MNHTTHAMPEKPPAQDEPEHTRGYTFRIPKPNWQVTALILIALIAGFQTLQLARLKGNVTAKVSAAASSPTAASTAPATDASGLQSQVGGC